MHAASHVHTLSSTVFMNGSNLPLAVSAKNQAGDDASDESEGRAAHGHGKGKGRRVREEPTTNRAGGERVAVQLRKTRTRLAGCKLVSQPIRQKQAKGASDVSCAEKTSQPFGSGSVAVRARMHGAVQVHWQRTRGECR